MKELPMDLSEKEIRGILGKLNQEGVLKLAGEGIKYMEGEAQKLLTEIDDPDYLNKERILLEGEFCDHIKKMKKMGFPIKQYEEIFHDHVIGGIIR